MPMTAQKFKELRLDFGYSTRELSDWLGLKPDGGRHIRRIESGEREISGPIEKLMRHLDKGDIEP